MIILISGIAAMIFIAFLCAACGGSSSNQNTGYQNTGYQNTEYQNTGYQNTGYQNTGYQNNSYAYTPGDMNNVVNCSCGFNYNRKNHDSCPNCGRRN